MSVPIGIKDASSFTDLNVGRDRWSAEDKNQDIEEVSLNLELPPGLAPICSSRLGA
jgi:hypothetical protein